MRTDARINRELVSKLLDENLDAVTICRRTKLSIRTVQGIAKYLHRKLHRKARRVKNAPLADVPALRRLVARVGVRKAAAKLDVSRQAVYQRLAADTPAT